MPADSVNAADPSTGQDLDFVLSTYCHQGGCVAVALVPDGGRAVRDTKSGAGPVLTFTELEWQAFIAGVKDGQFD